MPTSTRHFARCSLCFLKHIAYAVDVAPSLGVNVSKLVDVDLRGSMDVVDLADELVEFVRDLQ